MNLIDAELDRYLRELLPQRDAVVLEMEERARKERFPIIGPQVGTFCQILARALGARRIFEMGSGFGYSTVWFSYAVGEDGQVVHTEGSAERSAEARGYLERLGLAKRVRFLVGDARELIEKEEGPFDIIFCDIDKEGYPRALELAVPRLRKGGLLITDNTLWSGRVAKPTPDAATRAIMAYNRAAFSHPDLLSVILPLRDGVAVHWKR